MAVTTKYTEVFRTYQNQKRNINASARLVHSYLFKKTQSISKYNKEDADKLTKFFQEIKNLSNMETTNTGTALKQELMIKDFVEPIKKLGLDFTLGGKSTGGIAFEKEIQKLVTNAGSLGQETAASVIDLGTDNLEKAKEIVAEFYETSVDKLTDYLIKQIIPGEQFNAASPHDFYLKIGAKRYGKSDFQAGKDSGVSFDIEGRAVGDLARVESILKDASFSIKSYMTNREVHLGNTSARKAVSAVTEYVASQTGYEDAKWAGIYFVRHPKEKREKGQGAEAVRELYNHYKHMRSVYELTGLGLRYDDLQTMSSVDFLLVNRAGGDAINVYSTQELIKQFANKDKYQFSLNVD